MRRAVARLHSPLRITWLAIVLISLLVGCIRPVEQDQTATPSGNMTINNPGTAGTPSITGGTTVPATPTATRDVGDLTPLQQRTMSIAIANQLAEPVQEGTFAVYGVYSTSSGDEIYGMSFLNPSSLPCVAVLLMRPNLQGGLDYLIGDKRCATELSTDSVVASVLLVSGTSSYIATFGEVFTTDTVSEILISFPDGATNIVQANEIAQNRFLHVRPNSFVEANLVSFFDATSTLILEVTP